MIVGVIEGVRNIAYRGTLSTDVGSHETISNSASPLPRLCYQKLAGFVIGNSGVIGDM